MMTEKINALEADLVVNGGDVVNTNARELERQRHGPPSHRSGSRDGIYSGFPATTISDSTCGNAPVFGPVESVKLLEETSQDGMAPAEQPIGSNPTGADSIITVSGVNYPRDGFHNGHETDWEAAIWEATYRNVPDSAFNILISHTPQNWDAVRATGKADLTLSGHVHAMQMKNPCRQSGSGPPPNGCTRAGADCIRKATDTSTSTMGWDM
ncbi:MAG: hypothetical protein ACLR8Y_19815 [Alistipes indistinctus]